MSYLKLILLFVLCSFTSPAFSQNEENTKMSTFIKVWGFLKYHHPTLAKGPMGWDDTFLRKINQVKALRSKKELNSFYLSMLEELGQVEKCNDCKPANPSTAKFNADMAWLSDTTLFDSELISKLTYIQNNRYLKEHHYLSKTKGAGNPIFKSEKVYRDSIFPSAPLRMLTLARYWNIVNYFFPYRYQTDQNWNSVLTEMAPKFYNAKDTTTYHLAIMEMVAKIDDSHAKFSSKYTNKHFGLNWVPFKFHIIDNKAVVVGFFNEKLSKAHDIRIGDVFEKIEGRSIEDHIQANAKYIGASNLSVKHRDIHNILFHGNTRTVDTEFERNGVRAKKLVPRVSFNELGYIWGQDTPKDTIKILDKNIGYVNMGNLLPKQVPTMIEKLKDTKAIIFDVRNYPKGTLYAISRFLNNKGIPFVKVIEPDVSHPGTYKETKPLYAGYNNSSNYTGKVILLCNQNSQSHAEFTLMALQTAPNVTIVGSQTAGADGNVSLILLPGDMKTYITGLGIFYPDGRETQRIGIVPDIVVKPTIKGIREGRDEVLEKALALIEKN